MKTQETKLWRNLVISVATLLVVFFPLLVSAGSMGKAGSLSGKSCLHETTRPLSDFLNAQGTTAQFFPPVPDMLAWNDGTTNFGLVDYAGLADTYIKANTGTSLGTTEAGSVKECTRADGTAMISVDLDTKNALGFAQSIQDLSNNNFDFLNTPTIFGVKAQDVVKGAVPALGPAHLHTTFVIGHPGDPLPDILIAFQENVPDVRPITLEFKSTTVGATPNGTKARLRIEQLGATDETGNLFFTKEIVDIEPEHGH